METDMRRILIAMLAAAALVTFAIVAGCSDDSSPPNSPGGGGGGGTPATIHSGNIAANGGSFSFTFPDSGTTNYHCGLHPATMTGNRITVTSTSANDSVVVQIVNSSTPGFSPSAANVKPGGTVRWVNVHTMTHSVDND
jgi:plastocyanin